MFAEANQSPVITPCGRSNTVLVHITLEHSSYRMTTPGSAVSATQKVIFYAKKEIHIFFSYLLCVVIMMTIYPFVQGLFSFSFAHRSLKFGSSGAQCVQPSEPIRMSEKPGRLAQSARHLTRKSEVLGSIPGLATYFRFSFR